MESSITTLDYILLVSTSIPALGIGLYYATYKKQTTVEDYLFGGRRLNSVATGMSIVASLISSVAMTGLPAETYQYGAQFGFLTSLALVLIVPTSYFCIMPVFYKLQEASVYKYLEHRFDSRVRKLSSFLYIVQVTLGMSVITYATALTTSQMINQKLELTILVICIMCTIYTVFGGIKAVVWTDVLQCSIMTLSITAVCTIGIIKVGGIPKAFDLAYNSGRLKADFHIDPTVRDTVWSIIIGNTAQYSITYAFNQMVVQRCMSLKNYKDVKLAHAVSLLNYVTIYSLCTLSGVLAAAQYMYCDPKSTKRIKKPDQLMPLLVMDANTHFPGLAGFYIAGIISGGLSSLSTGMNSIAAVLYDFLKSALPRRIIDQYEIYFIKSLALMVGTIITALVYTIKYLGNIMPLLMSVIALTGAPLAGLFAVGLFIPSSNSKGAFWGGLLSMVITAWIIITSTWYQLTGAIKHPTLPVYTNSCNSNVDISSITLPAHISNTSDVPAIYKVSYHYYSLIGILLVVIAASVVSYLTKNKNHRVNDDLLSPLVHYIKRRNRKEPTTKYNTVEKALAVTDNTDINNSERDL